MKNTVKLSILLISASVGLWGCAAQREHDHGDHHHDGAMSERGAKAVAQLNPTQNNKVHGTVTFLQESGGVRVKAEVTGLTPGKHGFHIHEKGDCSAPDGSSAGGHFNPGGMAHGAPDADQRHAGDLGNLVADESGKATLNWLDKHLSFTGTNSIVGRGVIVHAKADDMKSQPAGDAGGRIACGVIERQ